MDINTVNTKLLGGSIANSANKIKSVQPAFKTTFDQVKITTNLDGIFAKATKTYGVSEKLLRAVAQVESGLNPSAVSKCGAQGIMQLMPKTAKALGVTDPLNPEQSIMGGAKYLSQMLKRYDGNEILALAAYNAGPGNVKKYGGVPPFKETENYIAKISKILNYNLSGSATMSAAISHQTRPVNNTAQTQIRSQSEFQAQPQNQLLQSHDQNQVESAQAFTGGYNMSVNSLGFIPNWFESFDPERIDEETANILLNLFALENL